MWLLKSGDRILFQHKDLTRVGEERMWYENRGYSVTVEKDVEHKDSQLTLPLYGVGGVVLLLLCCYCRFL